jgi:16S rRNA (adenine1518-N6/adenine1519-N6)-dimethyltransferase
MQTKQQIQQLLASAGISPNKHLGQHFLIDLNLMRLLVDSADIGGDDAVLEVGCGTGSLTEELAEKAGRVIAVEVDGLLATVAGEQLAEKKNVSVLNCDILENKSTINPIVTEAICSAQQKCSGRILLVANLPYNVSCPVIFNLVTGAVTADAMYVTVQKEVAERMTAGPGDGHYGILSILLAVAGEVKMERVLKPTVFWPQPQVASAMVSFVRDKEKVRQIKNMNLLSDVISLCMQHRRKMLQSAVKFAQGNLSQIDNWHQIFEECSIDPQNRPEQIQPEEFVAVANLCKKYLIAEL